MSDFVYFKSRINFETSAHGDSFAQIDQASFINKPVTVEFDDTKTIGTVLRAKKDERRVFETFIGPYSPDGNGFVEIVTKIDSEMARQMQLNVFNPKYPRFVDNVGIGLSCTAKTYEDKNTEITSVSLIRIPYYSGEAVI